jgi:hypothetical protein
MATQTTGARYEIRVRGVLGDVLLDAFPTLTGHVDAGDTVLSGVLVDQSALYGVFTQLESLGLELISVHQVAL